MNNYELMFIVRPTLDEASIKIVYEDMQNVVTKSKGRCRQNNHVPGTGCRTGSKGVQSSGD